MTYEKIYKKHIDKREEETDLKSLELYGEELLKNFDELGFKDVQPFRDLDTRKWYYTMDEGTFTYLQSFKKLYDHLMMVFNRNLLNELNNDLDVSTNYSSPIIEKYKVREMLKNRLENDN